MLTCQISGIAKLCKIETEDSLFLTNQLTKIMSDIHKGFRFLDLSSHVVELFCMMIEEDAEFYLIKNDYSNTFNKIFQINVSLENFIIDNMLCKTII